MVRASSAGSSWSAMSVEVESRAGSATSRAPNLNSSNSAMIARASSTSSASSPAAGALRSNGAADSTSATVRSKSARRSPSESRGHCVVISISLAGFRSVLSGAVGALSTVPH